MLNFVKDFPDGIYPAGGKSEIEGIFPPPYFEWFQFNKVCVCNLSVLAKIKINILIKTASFVRILPSTPTWKHV